MHVVGWLLFGLIVGAIAKLLMPGRDPGGCLITSLLGIAGSMTGGWLVTQIYGGPPGPAGWVGSVIGTMLLLLLFRVFRGRRRD